MDDKGPLEAVDLERAADWRIRKAGHDPDDRQSAEAAKLLQRLADDVRTLRAGAAYAEYTALLNWLGEFDVMEDFAERAHDYRTRIGVDHFPENGEAYLRALTELAKDTVGI